MDYSQWGCRESDVIETKHSTNNAAVNMRGRHLFEILILFPSDKYSELGLLDHMAVPFLIF